MTGEVGCGQRIASGVTSGVVLGTAYGAIKSAWLNAPGMVEHTNAWTMQNIRSNAGFFAGVGLTYSTIKCLLAGNFQSDATPDVIAGAASASLIGVRARSVSRGLGCSALAGVLIAASYGFDRQLTSPEQARRKTELVD